MACTVRRFHPSHRWVRIQLEDHLEVDIRRATGLPCHPQACPEVHQHQSYSKETPEDRTATRIEPEQVEKVSAGDIRLVVVVEDNNRLVAGVASQEGRHKVRHMHSVVEVALHPKASSRAAVREVLVEVTGAY